MRRILYIISILAILTSCADEDWPSNVTEEQKSLLGRAVNFNASISDPFMSRASYNNDGSFNEGDVMTIYRQYSADGAIFDAENEVYRVYYYKATTAGNTGILLRTEWTVWPGQLGSDGQGAAIADDRKLFTQTEADTLTWENGQTVRFRAWALSNLSGSYGNRNSFYPDFAISEWVYASGPTSSIPLSLRHIGCRMGFSPYRGNQISKVEICTDVADYMRPDNAGSLAEDEADVLSPEEAEAVAAQVSAVYKRMCMPGGVDLDSQQLKAMTQTYYGSGDFTHIVSAANQAQMIAFNTLTPEEIEAQAQRPVFTGNNGNFYSIAIPHDMSNDPDTSGDVLTLPAKTRFRIYLRDVNNGDGNTAPESKYHIFSLSDIKDGSQQRFPDGLTLNAGYSYLFTVGYLYGEFKVDADYSFSWVEQDLADGDFEDDTATLPTSPTPYQWWTEAINDAITDALTNNRNFNPKFTLTNKAEFMEFMNLVNGTAATNTGDLTKVYRSGMTNAESGTKYWWYDPADPVDAEGDTIWVTHAMGAEKGFIFFRHYYPADGDKAAYYDEDYLRGPYSFYSNLVKRSFTVQLDDDLDFNDVEIASAVGNSAATPFQGVFDGRMHTISNLNVTGGYLFGYTDGASISNLVLTGQKRLSVVNVGKRTKLVGIASMVPAFGGNSLAKSLTGTSYVVGCIHDTESVYDTPGALVGTADDLYMYGCMQTSGGIAGGALLGSYAGSSRFFAPQANPKDLKWGRFMCNYYDTGESPSAHAVDGITDAYAPQEYIRGRRTHILCAVNDHKVGSDVFAALTPEQKLEFYGLAPWRAMNYGIYQYNSTSTGQTVPCNAHYEANASGYAHTYPRLTAGKPSAGQYDDVLTQSN